MGDYKDECVIRVSSEAFDHMMELCKNPPPESVEKMRKLLSTPSILDADYDEESSKT